MGSEVAFQAPQRRARLVFALLASGSTTFWLFWSIHPYECDLWGVRGDASDRVLMSQPSASQIELWWSAMALRMHAWIGQRIWHHAFCIVYSGDLAETSCLFFFLFFFCISRKPPFPCEPFISCIWTGDATGSGYSMELSLCSTLSTSLSRHFCRPTGARVLLTAHWRLEIVGQMVIPFPAR